MKKIFKNPHPNLPPPPPVRLIKEGRQILKENSVNKFINRQFIFTLIIILILFIIGLFYKN